MLLVALASSLAGCPVLDRTPGGTTWLGWGALAVDPWTENTYVLRSDAMGCQSRLFAVAPGGGIARTVTDLGCRGSVRVVFATGGLLVISEADGADRVDAFDRTTLEPIGSLEPSSYLAHAEVSPSGRFVVSLAVEASLARQLEIIDTPTLTSTLASPLGLAQVGWLPDRDGLLLTTVSGSDAVGYEVRLRGWNASTLASAGFPALADGSWADPFFDLTVAGWAAGWGHLVASPDGRTVALPVQRRDATGTAWVGGLLFIDLETRVQRAVIDVAGGASFTPDGTTLVTLRYVPSSEPGAPAAGFRFVVIDVETLAERELDPLEAGTPLFFVAREGQFMLVTLHDATTPRRTTVLYDLASGEATPLDPAVSLGEHVSRAGEIWIASDGALHRLPLMSGGLEPVELPFSPLHLNVLPLRDRLVMDDAMDTGAIHFFDPEALVVAGRATLPRLPDE